MQEKEALPKVRRSIYTVFIKRLLDILLSGLAIIILSPLFIVIAILEMVFHGSPIVFSQDRPGLHGKVFKIYKFRSMTNETDANGELLPGIQRLTKFGRFIRKYSIDELPELFCILTGKITDIIKTRISALPLHIRQTGTIMPRRSVMKRR